MSLNMSIILTVQCSTAVYLVHWLQVTAVLAGQILLGQLELELPLSVSLPGAATKSGNLQAKNIRTGARVFETRFNAAHVTETRAIVPLKHVSLQNVSCSPCPPAVAACTPPPWRGTAQAAPSCTPRPSPPLTTASVSESVHSVTGKCLRCHNKHMSLVTAHYSPSDIQMSPVNSLSSMRPDPPVTSQSS